MRSLFLSLLALNPLVLADSLIIGIDQKVAFDQPGFSKFAPGDDRVLIYDLSTPAQPRLTRDIPLSNSVFGPPTNVALSPDGRTAIVADSVSWQPDGDSFKHEPAKTISALDLENGSISDLKHQGSQPSGVAFSKDGNLLAVANRAGGSVTLYDVKGSTFNHRATINLGGQISAVAITPDSSAIVASQFDQHSAIHVPITAEGFGEPTTLPVGRWPYNVQISADGHWAVTANNGNGGLPDGHIDTISLISLKTPQARVVDHITVGDGPEGLAISPESDLIVVPLLQGSAGMFKGEWFHNDNGAIAVLTLGEDGAELVQTIETGAFPEGIAFNTTGTHVYCGDHASKTLTIFAVRNQRLERVNQLELPGYPASLRSQLP